MYKRHKLLNTFYTNITSYWVRYVQTSQVNKPLLYKRQSYWISYVQTSQVTKPLLYKRHKLLSLLCKNVTSY